MKAKVTFFLLSEKCANIVQSKNILLIIVVFLAFFFWSIKGSSNLGVVDFVNNNSPANDKTLLVRFKNNPQDYVFKFTSDVDLKSIANSYRNNQAVVFVEPNYHYRAAILPSDTFFNNQWYLKKIKAPAAWDITRESPNIIIAIIDSGVQISHPDLKDNIWQNKGEIPNNGIDDDHNGFIDDVNGWDFVNSTNNPEPKFKLGYTEDGVLHGTIVAGVAAAAGNNAAGVSGITWRAQIMPLKVLDDSGEGETSNVVRAIDYAIANQADIINLSFIGENYSGALEAAIKRAYDAGVIVVAAAGNDKAEGTGNFLDKNPMYPVCYDGSNGENMIIGVAATDALDQKASFSGFGSKCVDIAAPGVSIFSTVVYSPNFIYKNLLFDKYYDGYWSGTSMAVPIVSGTLALIAGTNPGLARNEIVKVLLQSAHNIDSLNQNYVNQLGSGRVDVYQALAYAKEKLTNHTISLLLTSASSNSKIEITNAEGKVIKDFSAFPANFRGGVNLAVGDVDGDSRSEIVVAPSSAGAQIKVFDQNGKLKNQFSAFPANFRGGVNLAVGDVDGDSRSEIVVAPSSAGAQIKVFDQNGKLKNQFSAFPANFRGGVNLAVGDVDGDSRSEIVVAPAAGNEPLIKIFALNGKIKSQFLAYDKKFKGGVKLALADVDGGISSKKLEIITSPGAGGGPQINVFNNSGQKLSQFFAYDKKFKGGVNIAAGDFDYDGLDEILTGAGPGGAPHVRIFEKDGVLISSFYAAFSAKEFNLGINVGVLIH